MHPKKNILASNSLSFGWTGVYSYGQELFYKFVSYFTNKLVKQLFSMTVL